MRLASYRTLVPYGPCYDGGDPPKDPKDPDPKDPDPKDPKDPKDKPVQLTQERLDALIDQAYSRGAKNSTEAKEVQEELTVLREAKAELEKVKAGKGDATGVTQEQLDELKGQIQEEYATKIEALEERAKTAEAGQADTVAKFRTKDLERQVISAAGKQGAKDADDVFALMDRNGVFDYDDDSDAWVVKDTKGRVRLDVDNDMQPVAVDKAVAEFLDTKPHLKRSSGRTGSGPGAGGDGANGDSPELNHESLTGKDVISHGPRKVLDALRSGGKVGG